MSEQWKIIAGDCIEKMRELPENSIDSIVTDPPYGLEFMGKDWDAPWKAMPSKEFNEIEKGTLGGFTKLPNHSRVNNVKCEKCDKWKFSSNPCTCEAPSFPPARQEAMQAFQDWCKLWAIEAYRILKPGGHMLAFSGSRTYHRMTCAIEDAGFEIRDQIMWVYGSGFPKSHNVANDIDKKMGCPPRGRAIPMASTNFPTGKYAEEKLTGNKVEAYEARTEEGRKWQGWGTALKPAHEPIVLARKPTNGTVATNVLRWGTGALNIDATRVEFVSEADKKESTEKNQHGDFGTPSLTGNVAYGDFSMVERKNYNAPGRWPANFIHDGGQEVLDLFPDTGKSTGGRAMNISKTSQIYGGGKGLGQDVSPEDAKGDPGYGDSGSAARFFYCPKANKKDRDAGCDDLPEVQGGLQLPRGKCPKCEAWRNAGEDRCACGGEWEMTHNPLPKARNTHPTVKPTELMRYLCRLITPPGGLVLDPFNGSGSTGKAAVLEGFRYLGIEKDGDYIKIAEARIAHAEKNR